MLRSLSRASVRREPSMLSYSTKHNVPPWKRAVTSSEPRPPAQLSRFDRDESSSSNRPTQSQPRLVFPGGGIFFFWQAGAVTELRERGYAVSGAAVSGASAGALTATMTAAGVDFAHATERALEIGRETGVWRRPMGLLGIWGSLIERWLDEILPSDACDKTKDRLSVLLKRFPSFEKVRVTSFEDRSDLIRCNLASMHLPYFLDGHLTSEYRQNLHIDGSFLSIPSDHFPDCQAGDTMIVFDFQYDPILVGKKKELARLVSEDDVWLLFERGREYAAMMEDEGQLERIPRL